MKLPSPPFDVFLVVMGEDDDGEPIAVCTSAKCVEVRHSWWTVEHGNGSCTRHNGGSIRKRNGTLTIQNALGYTYALSFLGAYQAAMYGVILAARGHRDYKEFERIYSLASALVRGCAKDFDGMGRLMGRIERDAENHAREKL